jgi:hypothetical protein
MALSVKIKKVNIKKFVNRDKDNSYLITLNLILKDGGSDKSNVDFVSIYSKRLGISLKDFVANFKSKMQSVIDDYKAGNVDDIDAKLTVELSSLENDLVL